MTDEELQRAVEAQHRAAAAAVSAAAVADANSVLALPRVNVAQAAHRGHQAHHPVRHPAIMGFSPAAASMLHQQEVANRAAMMDNLNASGWFGPQAQAAMIHKQAIVQAVAAAAVAAAAAPHSPPPLPSRPKSQSQSQSHAVQRDSTGAIIPIGFFRDPQGNAWAASLQHPSQEFLNEANGDDSGTAPNISHMASRPRPKQPEQRRPPRQEDVIDLQSDDDDDDDDDDDQSPIEDKKERGRMPEERQKHGPSVAPHRQQQHQQRLMGTSSRAQHVKSPQRQSQGAPLSPAPVAATLRDSNLLHGTMKSSQRTIATSSSRNTPAAGPTNTNVDAGRPSSGNRQSAHGANPRSNLHANKRNEATDRDESVPVASAPATSSAINKQQLHQRQEFLTQLQHFHEFQRRHQQQKEQEQEKQDQEHQQQLQQVKQYEIQKLQRKEREERIEQQQQTKLELKQQLKQQHLEHQLKKKLLPTKQKLAVANAPPAKRPKIDSAPAGSPASKTSKLSAPAHASPSDLQPLERSEQLHRSSGAAKNPPSKAITGPFVQRWLGPGPNQSERDRDVKEFMDKVLMSTTGYTYDTAPVSLPFPPAEITLDAAQLEELAQDIVADRHKAIREAVRCSYVEMRLRHDGIVQDQKRDSEELHQYRREVAMLSLKHRNALNDLKAEHDKNVETMRQQITDLQQELQVANDESREAKATQAKSLETMMKASILSLRMIRKSEKGRQ